ncbi:MAG: MoxR family ATPase [Bdellovibrionales bacterium]|nr:MoxR family ATPase [Bdellovibrionales bacterium]
MKGREMMKLSFKSYWRGLRAIILILFGATAIANPAHEFSLPNKSGPISPCRALLNTTDFSKFTEQGVRTEILGVLDRVRSKIVGQEDLIRKIMVAILADGHVLLEGPPGVAKTKAVRTFADAIAASWNRIQFVSDMMPRDITGTIDYDRSSGSRKLVGSQLPFNLILGDEVNRASEKVHSALLEVMEERQFTVNGQTIVMPDLFLFLATQNPIEQRGTFKLPEAQLDRFLMKLAIGYPRQEDERSILQMRLGEERAKYQLKDDGPDSSKPLTSQEAILAARKFVLNTGMDPKVEDYILTIVQASRNPQLFSRELSQQIKMGAGPRGSQSLMFASMAMAWLNDHSSVEISDVDAIVHDVLRHRLILTEDALIENISVEKSFQIYWMW